MTHFLQTMYELIIFWLKKIKNFINFNFIKKLALASC